MKFYSILLLLIIPLLISKESKVKWLSPQEHDFGDIQHKVPVTHHFKFVNKSDAPLRVDNVRTSCGCTATDWEETPTPAGDTSSIDITYDAAKTGYFYKKIRVFFRGQRKPEILLVEGFVLTE